MSELEIRNKFYEQIRITAKGKKELEEVQQGLRQLETKTLVQIAHAEKTLLGITCTFGEADGNGFYNIPSNCTHAYEHGGDLHFAMPNSCHLILPKGKEIKFNINR